MNQAKGQGRRLRELMLKPKTTYNKTPGKVVIMPPLGNKRSIIVEYVEYEKNLVLHTATGISSQVKDQSRKIKYQVMLLIRPRYLRSVLSHQSSLETCHHG
jgi:hypothetical protein